MKIAYRDCEIEVRRAEAISGDKLLFYSVLSIKDGFVVTEGYSYDIMPPKAYAKELKREIYSRDWSSFSPPLKKVERD